MMYDVFFDEKIFKAHNSIYENLKKVNEPNRTFAENKKPKKFFRSLYDELIILIRTFQILGFFPVGRDHSGE